MLYVISCGSTAEGVNPMHKINLAARGESKRPENLTGTTGISEWLVSLMSAYSIPPIPPKSKPEAAFSEGRL